jgi:hypothetical protein
MYKSVLIFSTFFFFIFTNNILSQSEKNTQKSILIYNEGQAYLQSFIEKSITNLINVDSESPYFFSVNSFNRIYSGNKYKAQLNDLIRTQKDNSESSDLYYSKEEKIQRKEIFNILNNYDYFLTINTNTLGELIEFQFQLFKTISPNGNVGSTINKVISTENFFINPKDEKCYSVIEQSLQRLFTKSNRLPEAELNIYGKVFKDGTTNNEINLPLNFPILFDGSNSGDFDNDNISYLWRNITQKNEKYQTSKKILFKQDLAKQTITINDSGKYKIGFKVYDGINYSDEIILNINAEEKIKKTILLDSIKYSVNYLGILFRPKYKRTQSQSFLIEKLENSDSINKKIIITKTPIIENYIEYIDKSIIYPSYKFDYYTATKYDYYFSRVEIESTFDNFDKDQDENIYYIHDVNREGLVYNERKIKHKLRNRKVFSCGLKFENIIIENKEKMFEINSFSFLFNTLLTSKIEIEISIPFPSSKTLEIENANIKYPNFFNTSLRYFIIDLNKTKVLANVKPYLTFGFKSFKNVNDAIGKYNGSATFCYVPGLGIEKTVSNFDICDLSIRLNFQYGYFNDNYLKDYNLGSFGIDTIFRF